MNRNVKVWLLRLMPWVLLLGAFICFGVWVRSVQPWETEAGTVVELHGMDYRRYSQLLGGWDMIFYAAFRHPLYGLLMSPVIGVGSHFRTVSDWAFWGWLITFFSAVVTLSHFLVWWLLRRLALSRLEASALTALFASFAASWLLAACPESFNLSCLLALVTLHFALYVRRHADTIDRRLEYAGWGAIALATGGVTSTQVAKTALAHFATRRPKLVHVALIALGILGAGVLVGVVFMVRLYLRTAPGCFAQELSAALGNIGTYLTQGEFSLSRRLGCAFVFFTEPILTRGAPFSESILQVGYSSPLRAVLALLPPLAAVGAAFLARREFIVRVIAAMALVDFLIHFVLFWGMDEAQIYAGHWYYAVPILIGAGLLHLRGAVRFGVTAAIGVLSILTLALNLSTWL